MSDAAWPPHRRFDRTPPSRRRRPVERRWTGALRANFECSAFAGERIAVSRLQGVEELNAPYRFELAVTFPDADADASLLFGEHAVVIVSRGTVARRVCGIVYEVEELGSSELGAEARVVITPLLQMGALGRTSRIFQAKKASEILVLGGVSDLDFAHRLMEEEGIGYAFDHEGETEVMVLHDRNGDFPEAPASDVPCDGAWRVIGDRESAYAIDPMHRTTTTSVVVRDYDFTGPGAKEGALRSEDGAGRDRDSYEHGWGRALSLSDYDDGARRYQAKRIAHPRRRGAHVRPPLVDRVTTAPRERFPRPPSHVPRVRPSRRAARRAVTSPFRDFPTPGHGSASSAHWRSPWQRVPAFCVWGWMGWGMTKRRHEADPGAWS